MAGEPRREVTRLLSALGEGDQIAAAELLPLVYHELRKLAGEHPKQVLQVGLQRRYSHYYQTARQMIDKGILGKVTNIQAQWHRNTFSRDPWNKPVPPGMTDKTKNWRKYREFSGGLTAELGSHQIDVADWMFGVRPEMVVGIGGHDYVHDGRDKGPHTC